MKLTDALDNLGQVVVYYPSLSEILKTGSATMLFCQLFYWSPNEEGWIKRNVEQIRKATGLTRSEQATARKTLCDLGVIDAVLVDSPPIYAYRINREKLDELWESREHFAAERIVENRSKTEKARLARAEKRTKNPDSILCPTENQFSVQQRINSLSNRAAILCPTENQFSVGQRNINIEKNINKKSKNTSTRVPLVEEGPSISAQQKFLYELFRVRYEAPEAYGQPYNRKKADFIHLAKLIKLYKNDLPESLFTTALDNYFASEIAHRTLADLCNRFATFTKYALTEYKTAKKGKDDGKSSNSSQYSSESMSLFGAEVI
jgi:hypothetical protein